MVLHHDYSFIFLGIALVQMLILAWLFRLGRRTAYLRRFGREGSSTEYWHQFAAWVYAGWTLLLIGVIDRFCVKLGVPIVGFFWVHLPIATLSTLLLAAAMFFNGRRRPAWHRIIVRWQAALSITTFVTGLILTYLVIWPN